MSSQEYIIRDYDPADYDQLLELWNLTGLNHPERGDDRHVIERCIRMGGKLLIIMEKAKNKLVGSSWMTYDGRRIHLHHFAIHPEYQNRGLGKILTRESLQFVREMGQQVKLEVHKENKVAKHLYEKFGFFAFTDYDIYMLRDPDNMNL